MRPRNVLLAAFLIATAPPAAADRLELNDGRTLVGHILQQDPDTGRVVIGLVRDGKRTGIQEIFFAHEIRAIRRTGEYKDAPFQPAAGACYQYGLQWGRCSTAAYFGYRCADLDKFVVPQQCSDTPDMKRGIRDGVESVYLDFPEIPGRKTKDTQHDP